MDKQRHLYHTSSSTVPVILNNFIASRGGVPAACPPGPWLWPMTVIKQADRCLICVNIRALPAPVAG